MPSDQPELPWSLRRGTALVVTLVTLLAAAAIILIARNTEGRDQPSLYPGQIRTLLPGPGAQTPQQDRIGVVVAPNWTASLSVDGLPIPDDQLTSRPSLGEYFFDPGPGQVIEILRTGRVCATVSARALVGDEDPVSHTWCFTVF